MNNIENIALRLAYFSKMLCFVLFAFSIRFATAQTEVAADRGTRSVKEVLTYIEKSSDYIFVYGADAVNLKRIVKIELENKPIETILNQLFKGTDTEYIIRERQILLKRVAAPAASPRKAVVSGTVVSADNKPIAGAAVILKGTTVGVSTDANGAFALEVSAAGVSPVLEVNYLGYEPAAVAVANRTSVTITLLESALTVDEVVVTALGIKRSEKALSYNVQKVDGDKLLAVKDANFMNSLSGKVAGVTINSSSSGVGGASKVVMRGTKGIEQSSNALYVIDGVPMFNYTKKAGTEHGSEGATEAIADLNSEDIESISVLTGAAAAALYGSNAANGAIVITTKRGAVGRTQVTVSSNTEILSPFVMPSFQNRYGTGVLSSETAVLNKSWGHKLSASNRTGYTPQNDYFQVGIVGTESFAISSGSERNQTYFSAGAVNSRGIIPNNGYDRYNFTFRNTTELIADKLTLDVGATYINQSDLNMTNQGTYANPLVTAYLFPRGDDWQDIKMFRRYDDARKIMTQYWPQGFDELNGQNPYWINYCNLRENKRDRYMFNVNATYKITDWMNVIGRIRIDNSTGRFTEKFYATSNSTLIQGSDYGLYGITTTNDKQAYGDAILNIDKTFREDFSLHANIGGSFSDMRLDEGQIRGPINNKTGIANLFNEMHLDDVKTSRLRTAWHDQVQSVFASVELGYKNAYFVTVTARNDWPSQLAGPHSVKSSFFYPSVGASLVLSEIFNMPQNLAYLKLRASYASVGMPFARFLAQTTFAWNNSLKDWENKSHYPMGELKPEKTDSFEIGVTARFLKHFNLDLSYYRTNTFNQTFDPDLSVSSGYDKLYVQTGSVRNQGVEMILGYNNRWGKFAWRSNYTLSINRNKITELVKNYRHPETGELINKDRLDMGGLGQAHFVLKTGGTLGDLYSFSDVRRDENGNLYVGADGNLAVDTKVGDIKLGSVLPKANMAWGNDFTIGNFNLGFLVSARIGGIVYSATQAALDFYGVSEASAAARDRGGVQVDRMSVDAYKWYSTVGGQNTGIPQFYTYNATNIRLQEASIGYTIPRRKLGDVMEITLSLVGRNLWMIYNKAPFDPEAVATTGNYYQGIDNFMMPSLRSIGFSMRLKF